MAMQTTSRKRIALACNGCRAKRTKCDGNHPQCGACRYREEECQFTDAESKRKRPSNAYIRALEARVASLEQRLELESSLPALQAQHGDRGGVPEPVRPPAPPPPDRTDAGSDSDRSVDDLADALGCFALGDYGELCFFGASSNFSIMQNHAPRIASSTAARQRGLAAARALPNYFALPDGLRDHLLGLFWRWQNAWQYVVPRESFLRDLHVDRSGRYCTPLLLTAMCALAARYSPAPELRTTPDDANSAGELFIAQAQAMLHCEYEAPTTSTVQAAALLALYWVSIDQESVGFMYLGMASRMAMNTALHIDCSPYVAKKMLTEDDAEARAVAFWGLYALDNLFSLGMGRPLSILKVNITAKKPRHHRIPMDLDLRPLPAPGSLGGGDAADDANGAIWPTSYIVDSAMHLCDLFLLSSEIIDRLYTQRPTWAGKERDDRIMDAHLRLTRFLDHLPRHLKISDSSLKPAPPFVYMLHLQYHITIILLHRPLFVVGHRSRPATGRDDIHAEACLQSASKMSTILRIYRKNYTCRHMPISTVHCALTAAIIHLLDIRSTPPAAQAAATRRLSICLLTLYELNENWDWANRSIRALRSLAAQWKVDIWATGLADEIAPVNRLQYERYERRCPPVGPRTIAVNTTMAEGRRTGAERATATAARGGVVAAVAEVAAVAAETAVAAAAAEAPPPVEAAEALAADPTDAPAQQLWLAEDADPFAYFWPYDDQDMLSFNFFDDP